LHRETLSDFIELKKLPKQELIGSRSIYPSSQVSLSQLVNGVKPRPLSLVMIENYDRNVPQLTYSIFAFLVPA